MTDDDVRDEMQALARTFMEAEGLSLSAEDLARVEKDFARFYNAQGARRVGAYLGEVIIALGAEKITWVSFETAAAANSSVGPLGKDDATNAILRTGRASFWFPHVKVAK